MPPVPFSIDTMYLISPEYNKGYEHGYLAAKREFERKLKELMDSTKKLEPFATSTATVSTTST